METKKKPAEEVTMGPTGAQIRYATQLAGSLGYDIHEYNINEMTREELSELIQEFKCELEAW